MTPPTRIAFVCLGNICRSPMAEAVARALLEQAGLGSEVSVESFGTAGYHVGEPADPSAEAALARRGWPAGGHKARRITRADIEQLDLILCADRANLSDVTALAGPAADPSRIRLLRSYDPAAGPDAAVPDPWGLDADGFDRSLEMIERACRGLVEQLAARAD
jgi:protein-tyrosine phosphatase